MKAKNALLSQLRLCWKRFPQKVTNVPVREKRPFEEIEDVLDLVKQAEAEVTPHGGRVLLRYSGTELKARLLIEGRDSAVLERWSEKICDVLRRNVGSKNN